MSAVVSTHYADGRQIGAETEFGSEQVAAHYILNMRGHKFVGYFMVTTPNYKTRVRQKPLLVTPPPAKTPEELQDGMPF